MNYDVQEDNESIRWLFGKVKLTVRCMPMFCGEDGELKDQDTHGPDRSSPEGRFVEDFNENYEKIGKQFPAFLRLKELCKVQFLGQFLKYFQDDLENQIKKLQSGDEDSEFERMHNLALRVIEANVTASLDETRNNIEQHIPYIDDSIVEEVRMQSSIPASYQDIRNCLYSGSSHLIAKKIAQENAPTISEIRKSIIEHHEQNLCKYKKAVRDLQKCSSSFFAARNKCKWVPTVNNRKEESGYSRFHYGGVSLKPKLVKVNLSKPGLFSGCKKNLLTPGTFSSHRAPIQPSHQVFNPPRVKVAKTPGTQQSTSNSGSVGGSCKKGNQKLHLLK